MKWLERRMGRKKKYNSEKERKDAQRKWSMEYYYRNQAVIQEKARERYRKKKIMQIKEKQQRELYGE
tara:strand:+ start:99 stop:299 length:201 start_codon:yes stop_codon:yes gene_type:complete